MHQLLCKEIDDITSSKNILHVSGFDYSNIYNFTPYIGLFDIFQQHRGDVNHFTKQGNEIAFSRINEWINSY